MKIRIVVAVALVVVFAGCSSRETLVNNPSVLLNYQLSPSVAALDTLSSTYRATIVDYHRKGDMRPGLYSDYAVVLALQGRDQESCRWFNTEAYYFPASRTIVSQLKRTFVPAFMADTTVVNLDTLNVTPVVESSEDAAIETSPVSKKDKKSSKKAKKGKRQNSVKTEEEMHELSADESEEDLLQEVSEESVDEEIIEDGTVKRDDSAEESTTTAKRKVRVEVVSGDVAIDLPVEPEPAESPAVEDLQDENEPEEEPIQEEQQ